VHGAAVVWVAVLPVSHSVPVWLGIEGSIPTEIGQLTGFSSFLYLNSNKLTGEFVVASRVGYLPVHLPCCLHA
jgi:hypothetical protein